MASDVFNYIAESKPEETLKIFRQFSRLPMDRENLGTAMKQVYRNLPIEEKENFLLQLSEIHPDKELLSVTEKPYQHEYASVFPVNRKNEQYATTFEMGSMAKASGYDAVSHFMSSGGVNELISKQNQGINSELTAIKTEAQVRKNTNEAVFRLVIVAAIAFLLWNQLMKN